MNFSSKQLLWFLIVSIFCLLLSIATVNSSATYDYYKTLDGRSCDRDDLERQCCWALNFLYTVYMSQMLYAGQSAREIVTFFSDF